MSNLLAATSAFLLLHLLVSGTRARDAVTGAIGEGPYMGLFSLASIGLLVWLGLAFGGARSAAGNSVIWSSGHVARDVQLVLQLLAFLLVVPGLTTPNPTSVRQEAVLEKPDAIKGMLRITRHPFLWGVAIWAAGHILVTGNTAALIFFGGLLLLALFGTASIDAKRKRVLGDAWDAFAARTSNLPFAAILAGRQKLAVMEIGWWRIVLALVLYGVVLAIHGRAFGVSALP
ncbi:MAG TPA: NnrU family protein [Caulobacteraceae bacterium]|jgi:uncharacterized membrane protein|nr:NnrU family protein [Caulobacteraceae bacterium]